MPTLVAAYGFGIAGRTRSTMATSVRRSWRWRCSPRGTAGASRRATRRSWRRSCRSRTDRFRRRTSRSGWAQGSSGGGDPARRDPHQPVVVRVRDQASRSSFTRWTQLLLATKSRGGGSRAQRARRRGRPESEGADRAIERVGTGVFAEFPYRVRTSPPPRCARHLPRVAALRRGGVALFARMSVAWFEFAKFAFRVRTSPPPRCLGTSPESLRSTGEEWRRSRE